MNTIRFITGFTHGFIDYAGATVLITVPWILNFQGTSALAFWLSIGAGVGLLVYSLLTDYALSLKRVIPLKMHLIIDAVTSLTFLITPFILGFEGLVQWYFLANGALVMVAVLLTDAQGVDQSLASN